MRYVISSLYKTAIPDLQSRLEKSIDEGCRHAQTRTGKIELFFRADDIGVPSSIFSRFIALFQKYEIPLCLAVVPSWITPHRAQQLFNVTGSNSGQWCWHQHGRTHKNFESEGKKQEFGPARDYQTLKYQLQLGKKRLENILDQQFQPYFTPPWNRCSKEALHALAALEYKGISRFKGAKPKTLVTLPEFHVNVDLHTRKEDDTDESFAKLLLELQESLSTGRCGIMIHHQRMNEKGFLFLEYLLVSLKNRSDISPRLFTELHHQSSF